MDLRRIVASPSISPPNTRGCKTPRFRLLTASISGSAGPMRMHAAQCPGVISRNAVDNNGEEAVQRTCPFGNPA
jgi:hypothetical protein